MDGTKEKAKLKKTIPCLTFCCARHYFACSNQLGSCIEQGKLWGCPQLDYINRGQNHCYTNYWKLVYASNHPESSLPLQLLLTRSLDFVIVPNVCPRFFRCLPLHWVQSMVHCWIVCARGTRWLKYSSLLKNESVLVWVEPRKVQER